MLDAGSSLHPSSAKKVHPLATVHTLHRIRAPTQPQTSVNYENCTYSLDTTAEHQESDHPTPPHVDHPWLHRWIHLALLVDRAPAAHGDSQEDYSKDHPPPQQPAQHHRRATTFALADSDSTHQHSTTTPQSPAEGSIPPQHSNITRRESTP